jgi:tRNA G18 (ribose-2'-O)-methylase SpoU
MLDDNVSLPTWLYVLLWAAAVYAVVVSVLYPSVRWFVRRRLNRAVERLNTSLSIKIKPFQQTKRQELIDKLVFDPQVLALIDSQARETSVPREALLLDGGADSVKLGSVQPAEKTIIVVGNEGNGISQSLLDSRRKKVRIESAPGQEKVESLNAGVAVSIALWGLSDKVMCFFINTEQSGTS